VNKLFSNYTIQKIPKEAWIKFRVYLTKNGLHASKVLRSFIIDFGNKKK